MGSESEVLESRNDRGRTSPRGRRLLRAKVTSFAPEQTSGQPGSDNTVLRLKVCSPRRTIANDMAATAHGLSALKTASSTTPITDSCTIHLRGPKIHISMLSTPRRRAERTSQRQRAAMRRCRGPESKRRERPQPPTRRRFLHWSPTPSAGFGAPAWGASAAGAVDQAAGAEVGPRARGGRAEAGGGVS